MEVLAMKPVCVPCKRFFKCSKNDFPWVECAPYHREGEEPTWRDYKLWYGDKWVCPSCGASIIVGTALRPVSVRHEPNFKNDILTHHPTVRVEDC